ncbi:MAG: DUF4258 domain-containing protein [Acidobacteria bacterium]|nr:DUF4258 domain-containing protein [Acidobacteriota bacterium]
MTIRMDPHAWDRMAERGTSTAEVEEVIRTGALALDERQQQVLCNEPSDGVVLELGEQDRLTAAAPGGGGFLDAHIRRRAPVSGLRIRFRRSVQILMKIRRW